MSKYKDANKIYRKKMKEIRGVRDVLELAKDINDDLEKILPKVRSSVNLIKQLMAEEMSEQSAIYLGQTVRPNTQDLYFREEVLMGIKSQITHREFITYVNGDGKNDYHVKKYNDSRSQCVYLEKLLAKLWRKGVYHKHVENNQHFLHVHGVCGIKNILSADFLSNAFKNAEKNMHKLNKELKSIDDLICDKMASDRIKGGQFASKKEEKLAKNSARLAIITNREYQEFIEFLHRNKKDRTVVLYNRYLDKYNACKRELTYLSQCQESLRNLNHDRRFNMGERYGLEWYELIYPYVLDTKNENAYTVSAESRLLVENESVEPVYEEIPIRHDTNNSESLAAVEQCPPNILNPDVEGAVGGVSGYVDYENLSSVLHFRRSEVLVGPSLNFDLVSVQSNNELGASLDYYYENICDLELESPQDPDLMLPDDKPLPKGPNEPIRPGEPTISLYTGWGMESDAPKAGDLMSFDDESITSPDQHYENIEQLQQKIASISLAEPANTLRSVNVTPRPITGITYK